MTIPTQNGRVISLPAEIAVKALALQWTNGDHLAGGGSVASGWIDMSRLDSLRLLRTATGGAYALEVDWSRNGSTVDVTQALALNNNASGELAVAAPFARFRVRNTDALAAFSAHRTTVHGR